MGIAVDTSMILRIFKKRFFDEVMYISISNDSGGAKPKLIVSEVCFARTSNGSRRKV